MEIPGLALLENASGSVPTSSDGRAAAYVVLYPGLAPREESEESTGATPGNGRWTFQVTCAGGDIDRAEWAVTRVTNVFFGAYLFPDLGVVRQISSVDTVLEDTGATPSRWYYPAVFAVDIP